MRYFGLITFGFGFLGAAYFIVWGILVIAAPRKTTPIVRIFLGKRRILLYSEAIAKVSRNSAAVWGVLQIAFGLVMLQSLIRSLIHAYSR